MQLCFFNQYLGNICICQLTIPHIKLSPAKKVGQGLQWSFFLFYTYFLDKYRNNISYLSQPILIMHHSLIIMWFSNPPSSTFFPKKGNRFSIGVVNGSVSIGVSSKLMSMTFVIPMNIPSHRFDLFNWFIHNKHSQVYY